MKLLKQIGMPVAGILVAISTTNAFADGDTGARRVIEVGCDNVDTTCFVTLEGGVTFGGVSGSCNNTEVRWDSSTAYGKSHLALITAAWIAGKSVNLHIAGCYAASAWPTFNWAHYN